MKVERNYTTKTVICFFALTNTSLIWPATWPKSIVSAKSIEIGS